MDNQKFTQVVGLCQGREPSLLPSQIDAFIFDGVGDDDRSLSRAFRVGKFVETADAHTVTAWVMQSKFWEAK